MMPDRAQIMRAMCLPWLALAVCLLATAVHADGVNVRAYLDRDHVQMGDTATLHVEVDGSASASKPDLGALRSDFDIVGSSRSSSVSLVNGHGSIQTQWTIRLRPRHAGQLIIPSLDVDGHATAPLSLTVGAAPMSGRGAPGDPVFIRVTPSTRAPWVGQQIDVAVKLFYTADVARGSLQPPRGKSVDVQALGHGSRYRTMRDGRRYRVLERHYAVTARHAGPINLAPVTFEGSVGAGLASLFGNAHAVSARSAPIRLAVRSRPASWNTGTWLPARKLSLHLAGLPADGHVRVGQSLTLALTEKAEGLPFEVLPRPQLPKLQGVDVYPGKTDDHTDSDGHWLHGIRKRTFALVPQQAGTLTIPAITLAWWNVQTGRKETARIPAHTLTVIAAPGGNKAPPASSIPAAPPHAANALPQVGGQDGKPAPAAPAATSANRPLIWLALGLLLVVVFGILAFLYWRRRHRTRQVGANPTSRQARRAFLDAARKRDVATQCETLLAWARVERPDILHLGALAQALDRADQRKAVIDLQRARYAGRDAEVDADAMLAAFRGGLIWRRETSTEAPDPTFPPLYPLCGNRE